MVTRKKSASDKAYLARLGKYVENLILRERGYSSLDAFALEHHDTIAKATLYQICAGDRDMKVTTLRALAAALEIKASVLLERAE